MIRGAFHRMEPRGRERHRRATHLGERAGAKESNALQSLRFVDCRRSFAAQACSAQPGWSSSPSQKRAAGIGKESFITGVRSLANGHVLVARIVCGQGKSTYRSICALENVSVERMTPNGGVKPPVVRLKRAPEPSVALHPL